MKIRIAIIAAFGALLVVWTLRSNSTRLKQIGAADTTQTLQQQRSAANSALLAECTNTVTGLNKVTDVFLDDSEDAAFKWTARATVEYVNSAGGADRTNLHFIFRTPSGNLLCLLDPEWERQLQAESFQRAMQAATNAALNR